MRMIFRHLIQSLIRLRLDNQKHTYDTFLTSMRLQEFLIGAVAVALLGKGHYGIEGSPVLFGWDEFFLCRRHSGRGFISKSAIIDGFLLDCWLGVATLVTVVRHSGVLINLVSKEAKTILTNIDTITLFLFCQADYSLLALVVAIEAHSTNHLSRCFSYLSQAGFSSQ